MIKNSAKLYKDSDFHQPNKMTIKKKKKEKKANSFHLIFSNHFASCFNLIKLLGWEFPYIISSFFILRKVFWGMCRSEFFDKSLEKEIYWLKGKKMILDRSSIKFSRRQMFSLHKITCPFLFYLTLEGRCGILMITVNGRNLPAHR